MILLLVVFLLGLTASLMMSKGFAMSILGQSPWVGIVFLLGMTIGNALVIFGNKTPPSAHP